MFNYYLMLFFYKEFLILLYIMNLFCIMWYLLMGISVFLLVVEMSNIYIFISVVRIVDKKDVV